MNVIPNEVSATELGKLPAGFNRSAESEGLFTLSQTCEGAEGHLKHMEERHLGLAPKCLMVERPKVRQRGRQRDREKSREEKSQM